MEAIFPFLLDQISPAFSFLDSTFRVSKSKKSTVCAILWRETAGSLGCCVRLMWFVGMPVSLAHTGEGGGMEGIRHHQGLYDGKLLPW